jgi:hypothetical protein
MATSTFTTWAAFRDFLLDKLASGDTSVGSVRVGNNEAPPNAPHTTNRAICIMCMEANPDHCHRKTEIARRLAETGVQVDHIL